MTHRSKTIITEIGQNRNEKKLPDIAEIHLTKEKKLRI